MLSNGLNLIWRWSAKFPGSRPVTAFKRYIALVQFDTDYYYIAYPRATTNDVKAAHRVNAALEDFARNSKDMTPADFGGAYSEIHYPGPGGPRRHRHRPRRHLTTNNFHAKPEWKCLRPDHPLAHHQRAPMATSRTIAPFATISSLLPRDHRSPFAKISSTHLARLVVMDDVVFVGTPAREEHLKSQVPGLRDQLRWRSGHLPRPYGARRSG